jgi:hypothetical protein
MNNLSELWRQAEAYGCVNLTYDKCKHNYVCKISLDSDTDKIEFVGKANCTPELALQRAVSYDQTALLFGTLNHAQQKMYSAQNDLKGIR